MSLCGQNLEMCSQNFQMATREQQNPRKDDMRVPAEGRFRRKPLHILLCRYLKIRLTEICKFSAKLQVSRSSRAAQTRPFLLRTLNPTWGQRQIASLWCSIEESVWVAEGMRELKSSGVTRDFTRKICCSKMYCISNNGVNFGFKMLWRQKKKKSRMCCHHCMSYLPLGNLQSSDVVLMLCEFSSVINRLNWITRTTNGNSSLFQNLNLCKVLTRHIQMWKSILWLSFYLNNHF